MTTTPISIRKESVSVPEFESAVMKTYPTKAGQALRLADESAFAKTLVRSDQPQFGVRFGQSTRSGDAFIAATRPDEWLILSSVQAMDAAVASVNTGGFTSVIPFTHGRSLFRLTGELAPKALEKVCGIDFANPMTPNGAVVSASVALVSCDIMRDDVATGSAGGEVSYRIMCDRSFGQYLFDALVDAGNEFGISVD